MQHVIHGPWFTHLRAVLRGEDGGPWLLSMEIRNVHERVLDEFSNRDTAEEMFALCSIWLRSQELTEAYILNTEDAIIDSWQDYSLIDWGASARAEREELESNPLYGAF